MSSSLKKLVKNLSDNDFKYSTEGFGSKNIQLLSKWTVLKDLEKKICLIKNAFTDL